MLDLRSGVRVKDAMLGSTRWLVGLGAVVGVAIVAATLVALIAEDEQTFAEGTPERAVQLYLRAVADGDANAALALLTPEAQQQCAGVPREAITRRDDRALSATLERSEPRGANVVVRVRLTERFGDDPFGGGESTQTLQFELTQVAGAWRIVDPAWPLFCAARLPLPVATATATPR
jgi:hypothetical protein